MCIRSLNLSCPPVCANMVKSSVQFFSHIFKKLKVIPDHSQPLESYCPAHEGMKTHKTVFKTEHFVVSKEIGDKILEYPRNDPINGSFKKEPPPYFKQLIKKMFPDDNLEMSLIFGDKYETLYFRNPVIEYTKNIEFYSEDLDIILTKMSQKINLWDYSSNLNELSTFFVVSVLFKCLINPSAEDHETIAAALTYINQFNPSQATENQILQYNKCVFEIGQAINEAIELNYSSPSSFIHSLVEKAFNENEIKATLFLLLVGGTEQTASLLDLITWQLGTDVSLQYDIYKEIKATHFSNINFSGEIFNKTIVESTRLFISEYVLKRTVAKNHELKVETATGQIFQKQLKKNEEILICPSLIARDPNLFEDPLKFDPHRENFYPNLAFGSGFHKCPCPELATKILRYFTGWLVNEYRINLPSPEKIRSEETHGLNQNLKIEARLTPRKWSHLS